MTPADELLDRYPDLLANADPATMRMVDSLHQAHSAVAPPHLRSAVARLARERQPSVPDRALAIRRKVAQDSSPVRVAYLATVPRRRSNAYAASLLVAAVVLLLLALRVIGHDGGKGRDPVVASLMTTTATALPVATPPGGPTPVVSSQQATVSARGLTPDGLDVQAGSQPLPVNCTADVSQWSWARAAPKDYVTKLMRGRNPTVYLASRVPDPADFWTVLRSCDAAAFRGHRVQVTTEIKVSDVTGWVGLWMRVDGESQPLAFDNMEDRPITGTTGWHRYSVVLDVAPAAKDVYFGVLLAGKGETWIRGASLSAVGANVPTTDQGVAYPSSRPRNLDFAQGLAAWSVTGDQAQDYQLNVAHGAAPGSATALVLEGHRQASQTMGYVSQACATGSYAGHTVRFSADVKTTDMTSGWAGLWLTENGPGKHVMNDSMANRPISGNTGWHRYAVNIYVMKGSTDLVFGAFLRGTGKIWLAHARLEIVG